MASSPSSSRNLHLHLLLPFLLVSAALLLPFISCCDFDEYGERHIEHGDGYVSILKRLDFRKAIDSLMDTLKEQVPSVEKKIVQTEIVFQLDGSKIQGRGECDGTLDEKSCRSCLSGIKNYLMDYCMFFSVCQAVNLRCNLGYSN